MSDHARFEPGSPSLKSRRGDHNTTSTGLQLQHPKPNVECNYCLRVHELLSVRLRNSLKVACWRNFYPQSTTSYNFLSLTSSFLSFTSSKAWMYAAHESYLLSKLLFVHVCSALRFAVFYFRPKVAWSQDACNCMSEIHAHTVSRSAEQTDTNNILLI
jgi:hypothetical protein